MFRNIKLTLRSLRRNGVYSIINIAGLAISLATCAFIVLWVQDERSFDRFHKDAENIYLTVSHFKLEGDEHYVPLSPGVIGPTVKEDFPSVEGFCRIRNRDIGYLRYEDIKTSSISCYYADSTFFNFFNFPIVKGNRDNPLRNPNDVVISERLAGELFGKENPVGKTVLLDDGRSVNVTAVMKDFPKNTFLNWGTIELVSLFAIDPTSFSNQVMNIWEATEFFSYIKVKKGTDVANIAQHLFEKQPEMWQHFRRFLFQPLVDLHLYSLDGQPAGIKTVRLFQWIALIILVIACINYVNLVTARASKRRREIGLKKVIGAKKRQLFLQLISEAVILFVIAIFVALILNRMLAPAYYPLSGKEITFRLFDLNIWLIYSAMLVVVVALAGIYPAWLLASFRATTVIQTVQTKRGSNLFRKALVVTQFVASTAMIAGTIVIAAQMKYMREKDPGYDREHVLMCPMMNMKGHYTTAKAELERQASILDVTAASENIMDVMAANGFGNWEGRTNDGGLMYFQMQVDTSFLRVMRLTLVDGTNFTSVSERQYIMNEAAVKTMGLTEPVGKWVNQYNTRVAGVVKDFHFRNLHYEIGPFVMYYDPDMLSYLYVRTRPGNTQQAVAAVEKLWKQYNPDYAFNYSFMDDTFNRMYVSEIRTNYLFSVFSGIAILISCLGLLGLVVFSAELKTKEIGIRKALGASILDIVKLLSREFLIPVGISILIALPLAYRWSGNILRDFAYRIPIGWWMFALAGVITIVLTFITVGWQAVKAAMENPVKAIKSE